MKLSGYTTVRNCVSMDYPMKECIQSLVEFCDEVIVMDSTDKDDGTKDVLSDLLKNNKGNLRIYTAKVDWTAKNHGVFDGALKQAAKEKCTGDFLLQSDVDEIFHKEDRVKLEEVLKQTNYLSQVPILCLPVVEYWGSYDKVRIDVNPWKWRVIKNIPEITHGIPIGLRNYINDTLYSKPGSDGCNFISKTTGQVIPDLNFMNQQVEDLRLHSAFNEDARKNYEMWFNNVVQNLPTSYHYSWFSIKSKIEKYKVFWNTFWPALYGSENPSKDENVFFPGIKWEDVTNEMIEQKALELKEQTGGHVFHTPWTGQKTPSIKINKEAPEIMKNWCLEHPL